MLYDTPTFTGWQLEHLETLGRVYRLHRRMLQTFQHGARPAALAAEVARARVDAARSSSPSIPTRS